MSGREWKNGDVALVKGRVGMYVHGNSWEHGDEHTFRYWHSPDLEVRPLVVIDPEDREQVDAIEHTMAAAMGWTYLQHGGEFRRDALQAALREFAAPPPPRPEEPTGHFAVVEDSSGERWVNYRDPRTTIHHARPWVNANDSHVSREYDDIAAVRVLSEGIS